MDVIKIIVGGLLLTLGRKIYWLFVALVGFALGLALAGRLFQDQPEWVALLVGIVLGLLGAVLARFFQKLALGIAGFAAGAFIVDALLKNAGSLNATLVLILTVVGGLIGAAFVSAAFDWALIALSSAAGALLVARALPFEGAVQFIILLVLFSVGVLLQFGLMRGEKH